MSRESTGDKKLDSLRDRAASKIIWGEDPEKVYQFLRKQGVSAELAEQFLLAAERERAAIIRQRSLIKFIVGAVGVAVSGGLLLWFEVFSEVRFYGRGYGRLFVGLLIGLGISGVYALKHGWALLTGRTRGYAMDD